MRKNDSFTYFNFLILCKWLQVINKVKVTYQGEGHIKVNLKYLLPFQLYVKCLLILPCESSVCGYRSINKVKVTHQGQSKISTSLQILCSPCSLQAGGFHSTEMLLVLNIFSDLPQMALPPCHAFVQFYVANAELSCQIVSKICRYGMYFERGSPNLKT